MDKRIFFSVFHSRRQLGLAVKQRSVILWEEDGGDESLAYSTPSQSTCRDWLLNYQISHKRWN
jgi:hypothetical protein